MKKINYLPLLGFAVLYVVSVFATAFLGYLSPFAWVFFPVIAALLGSFSYYLLAVRWQQFGVSTLLSFLLAAFLLITGECKLGFKEIPLSGNAYERCDILMELVL